MKDYTKEELDKKIESFLTKKFNDHPELQRHDSKRSKRLLRERGGFMSFFLPTQPTAQF